MQQFQTNAANRTSELNAWLNWLPGIIVTSKWTSDKGQRWLIVSAFGSARRLENIETGETRTHKFVHTLNLRYDKGPKPELHPYQKQAIAEITERLQKIETPVIALPTGTGKPQTNPWKAK